MPFPRSSGAVTVVVAFRKQICALPFPSCISLLSWGFETLSCAMVHTHGKDLPCTEPTVFQICQRRHWKNLQWEKSRATQSLIKLTNANCSEILAVLDLSPRPKKVLLHLGQTPNYYCKEEKQRTIAGDEQQNQSEQSSYAQAPVTAYNSSLQNVLP